ncbi:MAG TPA: hypothetical protein DD638_11155 [Pasteurellaceae bacterium]|nr:hypothetical protein [Pasteurellaceae bacterium]
MTASITPGDNEPSTFSTGAGVLLVQAVNTAIATGTSKNDFFMLYILKIISCRLAYFAVRFPASSFLLLPHRFQQQLA